MTDIIVTLDTIPSIGQVEVQVPGPVEVLTVVQQGPVGPMVQVKSINGITLAGVGNMELSYVHAQVFPSDTWTVTHGLSKWPSVTVVDSAGSQVIGEVAYVSDQIVSLKFAAAFSGQAFFN